MTNNPIVGASYFFRGLALITKKGVRAFVLIPLLINTLVFALLVYYGAREFSQVMDRLVNWLPDWLDWLSWLLWPVFALTVVLIFFFGFSLLANLIAAPFNGLLSEAVEKRLRGLGPEPGSWKRLLSDLFASLASELRKLIYFLVRAVPILILFLATIPTPGLQIVASMVWMLFSAWMLAIEYADYPMGNHGIGFTEQRKRLSNARLLSLGFGGTVMLALMVPVFNFLVIPTAVAGATAMWVEQLSEAS